MILVAGGTGTVGRHVVETLAAGGHTVRALVRDPGRAQIPRGVELVQGELERPETLDAALDGVDHAFLLTPFVVDQDTLQNNLVDAAARRGGVHVVKMGVIGADPASKLGLARQFGRTDARLRESGLDWTLLHPHAFMQNLLASSESIRTEGVFYGTCGEGRIGTVDVRDIAAVAAVCLTEPGHTGKTYLVTGPESISHDDMAEAFSRVLGREIRYVDVPSDMFKESLLGFGLPEPLAEDLRMLYGEVFRNGGGDVVTTAVADVTGRPPRSFDQFVRDHAEAFGGQARG